MELYHYTDLWHLRQILEDGYLKLTPSNLLQPKNVQYVADEHGRVSVIGDTDDYKPVVWATSILDFDRALQDTGLDIEDKANVRSVDKSEAAIVITNTKKFRNYEAWAKRHKIDRRWFEALTRGRDYKNWYVCEERVPIDESVKIAIRPDVLEQMGDGYSASDGLVFANIDHDAKALTFDSDELTLD